MKLLHTAMTALFALSALAGPLPVVSENPHVNSTAPQPKTITTAEIAAMSPEHIPFDGKTPAEFWTPERMREAIHQTDVLNGTDTGSNEADTASTATNVSATTDAGGGVGDEVGVLFFRYWGPGKKDKYYGYCTATSIANNRNLSLIATNGVGCIFSPYDHDEWTQDVSFVPGYFQSVNGPTPNFEHWRSTVTAYWPDKDYRRNQAILRMAPNAAGQELKDVAGVHTWTTGVLYTYRGDIEIFGHKVLQNLPYNPSTSVNLARCTGFGWPVGEEMMKSSCARESWVIGGPWLYLGLREGHRGSMFAITSGFYAKDTTYREEYATTIPLNDSFKDLVNAA